MSESAFIKNEALSRTSGIVRLNWRLFLQFHLFWKTLPLCILTILLASAAPSIFRWYSGHYLNSTSPLFIPYFNIQVPFHIMGLVIIVGLSVLFRILAWVFFEVTGMLSSHKLHDKMTRSLSHTRTTFFDENPSARIINRLVVDFDELRSTAIIFAGDFLNSTTETLSIGVIASFANPWAGLLILPLLFMFSYIQYQRSAMLDHARSLSAQAKSSVLGRNNDLIEGREIYLLYGKSHQLLYRMRESYQSYIQASGLSAQIEAWGSFWIRVSGEVFSLLVLLCLSYALSKGNIDTALAGVIISSLLGISGSIGWLDLSTSMISRSAPHIRRVFEYIDLPSEETEEQKTDLPISQTSTIQEWGDLVFENYGMSYRKDTPLIFESLNLRLEWGKKTAIIGRTGSGKTSIIQALLRMVYVQNGTARIGSHSIYEIPLNEYRQIFGIVPQFPYLFEGTVRLNLDRSNTISQHNLEKALQAVGLDFSLDKKVSEGGQNLSQGERQLLCLARVIAADRKIIIMDEPTSGLDPETDARIHRVLHTALQGKTVITIAHRKESLGNYDWIVEMKNGKVVQRMKGSRTWPLLP